MALVLADHALGAYVDLTIVAEVLRFLLRMLQAKLIHEGLP